MSKKMELPVQVRGLEDITLARMEGEDDKGGRRFELSFSSERSYRRYFGEEILGHDDGEIRLDFLSSGRAPFLADHNRSTQIGVVESIEITGGKGRAVVRFGKGSFASEMMDDVIDGIRANISVGYRVHEMQLIKSSDDGDVYRVTDWEPLEISLVSIPADPSVGIGRDGYGERSQVVIDDKTEKESDEPAPAKITVKESENMPQQQENQTPDKDAITSNERQRVAEIYNLGVQHGVEEKLVREAIGDGSQPGEFARSILSLRNQKTEEIKTPVSTDIGLTKKEIQAFSITRALACLAMPNDKKVRERAAFELECSEAAEKQRGKSAVGLLMPSDVLSFDDALERQMEQRDLNAGTGTAGGNMVSTNLLASQFIDLLRNRMVAAKAGAIMLPGLVGDVAIPRQTGGATAYWIATEGGDVTESQQTIGQLTFTPKTVGALTEFTRQLLLQSSVGVEQFIRNDFAKVLGLGIDLAALYGSGASGQPTGVVNTSGINTKTFTAAGDPTWAEVVELETLIAADNADVESMAYLGDPAMRGAMKVKAKDAGSGQFVWTDDDEVNGYRALCSNQMTADDLLMGNFADLIMALWGGLDLTVDPYSKSASGTVRIVALQSIDIGVRNAVSFCLGNGGA